MPSPWAALWPLDPSIDFLNHGSFGACPLAVLEHQREWQRRLERDPVAFIVRELETELDQSRAFVAAFLDAEPEDLVFVSNATSGVNAVLASLALTPGDEVLVTSHGYPACANAARRWAARSGATVVTAELPFPVASTEEAHRAVLGAVTARTRVALIDHVTSPTALVLPVAALVRDLRARGVVTLIDGAHAPGMVALSLRALDADYYTGNFHKWCCSPKGAAFLWVRGAHRSGLRPLVTSHGASSSRTDRPRHWLEFDWAGTTDPSALLSVPFALRYVEGLLPGGWPAIRRRNHDLVLEARRRVAETLGLTLPCPDSMIGSMATLRLSDDPDARVPVGSPFVEPLYGHLYGEAGLQVMAVPWPALPSRVVRLSAHLYNDLEQFERLARALSALEAPE